MVKHRGSHFEASQAADESAGAGPVKVKGVEDGRPNEKGSAEVVENVNIRLEKA